MKPYQKTILNELKMLYGLPPHDGSGNPCAHDGLYAKSLERKWDMSISELMDEVNFDEISAKYKRLREEFLSENT